jgi:flagellar hook-length control protein FliK
VDASAELDFAQVLDALLSPARADDPTLVARLGTREGVPDAAPAAPGEDGPPDAPAAAAPALTPPQALPQAIVIPVAVLAPPAQPGPDAPPRVAAALAPSAVEPGPARLLDPGVEETAPARAAVDLAPSGLVSAAKIAAEPTQAPDAAGSLAPGTVMATPATATGADAAVTAAPEANLSGLVPAERAVREATAAPPADPARTAVRVESPDFADDFGSRVVWMAGRNQQAAEFRIDPPQLGPVEVRLSLANDQASLVLLSPHASVRDALQATLPRLHDLLAAAGINLGSVHVGAQGHSAGQPGNQTAHGWPQSTDADLPGAIQHAGWVTHGRGIVDVYA